MNGKHEGLIFALAFDGQGGAQSLNWDEAVAFDKDSGVLWLHLDYTVEQVESWLNKNSDIPPIVVEGLCADESRPRSLVTQERLLLNLRGVSFNPEHDANEMLSLRMLLEPGKEHGYIVTLRRFKLPAIMDIRDKLENGDGPRDTAEFLVSLTDQLVERTGTALAHLDEQIDQIEEEVLTASNREVRTKILQARQQCIGLRRYLAPQRDVISRLPSEKLTWLEESHRLQLREVSDRAIRHVEDLDEARERASIASEELANRLAEQMNRNMYVVSIVATIFLPLGLLTGLLGINVAGIPGTETPDAFWIVCGLLVLLGVIEWILFKKLKWV